MTILVVCASRHGSTRQIADVIAEELKASGYVVDVHDAAKPWDMGPYDGAIIGSAVYMGKWLPEARDFVKGHREQLAGIPVWLFSSGPLGNIDPQPPADSLHIDEFLFTTGAHDHRIFEGKLDRSRLGFGERLAVKMVKAPEGDFRDWKAIRAWAQEIATSLKTLAAPAV